MLIKSSSEIKFISFEEAGRTVSDEVFNRKPNLEKTTAQIGSFKWMTLDEGLPLTIDYIKTGLNK